MSFLFFIISGFFPLIVPIFSDNDSERAGCLKSSMIFQTFSKHKDHKTGASDSFRKSFLKGQKNSGKISETLPLQSLFPS